MDMAHRPFYFDAPVKLIQQAAVHGGQHGLNMAVPADSSYGRLLLAPHFVGGNGVRAKASSYHYAAFLRYR